MEWRKIPDNCEHFLGEDEVEYFICAKGWVLEGRHFENGDAMLEKAILPTVQGNRAYIRVRRKGLDKKYQLIRIFNELFPELFGSEIVIETRKGPWTLTEETRKGAKAAAVKAPRPAAQKKESVRKEPAKRKAAAEAAVEDPVDEAETSLESDEDIEIKESHDVRACKVCNLKKRVQEFSPREDMCLDCYLGRDELLKEIIAKRKRAKQNQMRIMRDLPDEADEKIDNLDSIDYGISISD